MELRHLLYFKTVAEELHFRNAAAKLYISQPPLSRQIRELEDELQVLLFERDTKNVALTDAGKYFKEVVNRVFSILEESKNITKQIHDAVSGQLAIGYISSTDQPSLIEIIRRIRQEYPFVKTRLYEIPTIKQIEALETGKLDIGILRAPVNSKVLRTVSLFTDPFAVVTARTEEQLTSLNAMGEYLKEQPFVFFNQDYAPEYFRKLLEMCQRMGFSPDLAHEANNIHSILQLVESGMGVSIVPASLQKNYAHLNLSFFPLNELPINTEIVLAYRAHHLQTATSWFIENYLKLFEK